MREIDWYIVSKTWFIMLMHMWAINNGTNVCYFNYGWPPLNVTEQCVFCHNNKTAHLIKGVLYSVAEHRGRGTLAKFSQPRKTSSKNQRWHFPSGAMAAAPYMYKYPQLSDLYWGVLGRLDRPTRHGTYTSRYTSTQVPACR